MRCGKGTEVWEGRKPDGLARIVADYQTRDYHKSTTRVKKYFKWFVCCEIAGQEVRRLKAKMRSSEDRGRG